MDRYTIKLDLTDRAMRQAIDLAVHNAIQRFRNELGEHENLAHRIASAAAANAIEQFKTWCNSELRLIEAEHERLAENHMLKSPKLLPLTSE